MIFTVKITALVGMFVLGPVVWGTLYFLFSFTVDLKLLYKMKYIKKINKMKLKYWPNEIKIEIVGCMFKF